MMKKLENLLEQNNLGALPSVLIAAAECTPFAKTGGLADVVGALATELKRIGFDVRVILPYHRVAKDKFGKQTRHIMSFSIDLGWRSQYVGIETMEHRDVTYYLIDNEYYFGYEIYKGGNMEGEQYAFFSRAVIEALPLIGFLPDILHVNDWHTAMIPMLLKTQYEGLPQGRIKSVLTIHNLGYHGKYDFGFASDLLNIDSRYYCQDCIEHYGCVNFLKSGLVYADKLTTVSPTYANEIQTPYFGEGLEGVIKSRAGDLTGIINGIDTSEFNPKTDPWITQNYDNKSIDKKQENKDALLNDIGLTDELGRPLISMVSRLTEQKGLDLIIHVFDELMEQNINLIVLGSGDSRYEDFFRYMQGKYPQKMVAVLKYDNVFAHRLYAGSDFFLMPSRFEPCGVSQLIAMRYGTLPIVHATGGLKDTVQPYNGNNGIGNGFSFDNYNAHDMLNTIKYAIKIYKEDTSLILLREHAMKKDVSFKISAIAYAELYIGLKAKNENEPA